MQSIYYASTSLIMSVPIFIHHFFMRNLVTVLCSTILLGHLSFMADEARRSESVATEATNEAEDAKGMLQIDLTEIDWNR